MATKLKIVKDEVTGKFVLRGDSEGNHDDCYVALRTDNTLNIVKTQQEAEEFCAGVGGNIYLLTHYDREDSDGEVERLPQSHLIKEVKGGE